MKIILARHSDAQNQDGVFHGVTNVPLTKEGQDKAYDLAEEIRQYKPSVIYSSPVRRSLDTAKILGGILEIPVKIAKELNPLNLGSFVGKDTEKNIDGVKYYLMNPSEQIPKGESVNSWANKYLPFFDKLFKHKSDQSVVFVTHGRNIVLTRAHLKVKLKGFNPEDLAENTDTTEHAGISIASPPNKFELVDGKKVPKGQS